MKYFGGKTLPLTLLLLIAPAMPLFAQDEQITLRDFSVNKVKCAGFTLNNRMAVTIEAVGAGADKTVRRTRNNFVDPQNMFAYAWIINAKSRQIKWRMTPNNTESDWWGAKYNRKFEGEVQLDEGEYELYYAAFSPVFISMEGGYFSLKKLWEKVFGDEDWWEENADQWYVTIRNVDQVYTETAVEKYQNAVKKSAIVSLTEFEDSDELREGFTLKESANLRIYAIGEGFDGEMYDYGYIIDANSRERVWQMEEGNTEHAGGALKNRLINQEIRFNKGDYIVYFQSDDSHSYEEWNANPPYDPSFWGITVSGSDPDFDSRIVYKFEESPGNLIVRLDRLGDYEEVFEGFTLERPMKLRIYAIGEGRDGKMFDYGWIENAANGRKVWQMDYSETDHAGGGEKNRRFDNLIYLDAGSYLAYFITDDSHSFRDWNRPKPLDPAGWGMKLYTVTRGDDKFVKKYDPEREGDIIAQMTKVGDDEHLEKQFTIDRDTDVRIYAIGEGDRDEMYDFAWLEEYNTGRSIWIMRYRETRRAGGANKNRLYDGILRLKKGTYILHYLSDDSHSYDDWNETPPRDKRRWGVTIYKSNGE